MRFQCDECGVAKESMKGLDEHKQEKHEYGKMTNNKIKEEDVRKQDKEKNYDKNVKNMRKIKENNKRKDDPENRGENVTKEGDKMECDEKKKSIEMP